MAEPDSTNVVTPAARLRALTFCLNRSRFSVIVLAAGLALLLSDQGRDLLTAYNEDGKTGRLAVGAGLWAVSIWGWCRALLDIRYDDPPSCLACYNFWRRWMPRFLGALAFIVVAAGAARAGQAELTWWALGGLAVFLVVTRVRRAASRFVAAKLQASRRALLISTARSLETKDIAPQDLPPHASLQEALGMAEGLLNWRAWKARAFVVWTMFLCFAILALLGNLAPVKLGHLGAMLLFFLWAATWLPLGSLMSYVADKRGIPLLSLLAVLALLFSYTNDNHEIRHAGNGVPVDSRPSVSQALEAWAKANGPAGGEPAPFVIVATAGGGIRAAYWTATVLGDLHDRIGKFPERTFALSGVSGGSVGATVYRALLALPPERFRKACPNKMKTCAQQVLGKDLEKGLGENFLGSLAAALLYPDLAQRFWPWPWFRLDRAAALEESWEKAFKDVAGDDRLNASIAALGVGPRAPSLFLNSTWVDNGRRIVASNLRFAKDIPDEAKAFERSNDELAVLGHDLRLSTAAHNSARFPYVSPPGMWKKDGKIAGRLQDGGLFENYGAETALEILDLACRRFACPPASGTPPKPEPGKRRVQPVVILISSDPSLPEDPATSPRREPVEFAYEIRATLTTYEETRVGRGDEAAARLKEWALARKWKDGEESFFYFRMCPPDSEVGRPPLGWALSEAAMDTIDGYLDGAPKGHDRAALSCYEGNAAASKKLRELLAR